MFLPVSSLSAKLTYPSSGSSFIFKGQTWEWCQTSHLTLCKKVKKKSISQNYCFKAWNGGKSIHCVWIITLIMELWSLHNAKLKLLWWISKIFLYMPNWWTHTIFQLLLPLTSLQYWGHVFIYWGKTVVLPISPHNWASPACRHTHTHTEAPHDVSGPHLNTLHKCPRPTQPTLPTLTLSPLSAIVPRTPSHMNTFHTPDIITADSFMPCSDVALPVFLWVRARYLSALQYLPSSII